MALFGNFNGMGPEGAPTPPPRTALGRLWQVYSRHTFGLMASGGLAGLASLVYIASLFFGITSHGLIFVLVGCPIGGALMMPEIVGVADTVFRSVRGEAGFWGMKYRAAWRRNLGQSVLFGALAGLLFGFQYFMMLHAQNTDIFIYILMLIGLMLSVSVANWTVAQIALVEVPFLRMLLNGLVLTARHPLKSLGAVVITVVYWLFMEVAYPFSLLFAVLFNFWLPMLITMMMLWKPMDETFSVTERIDEMNARKKAEEEATEEE